LGPPGGSKKEVSALISKDLDLNYLSAGQLIYNEIEQKTPLGKQITDAGFNDIELVDDHIVTTMINQLVKENDELIDLEADPNATNTNKGWIIDGFPRTFNQAQLMQVSGYLPDKVFVLVEDENICKQKLARRFATVYQLAEDEAYVRADIKYRNYLLYLNKIRHAFSDILIELNAVKQQPSDTFLTIKKIIEI